MMQEWLKSTYFQASRMLAYQLALKYSIKFLFQTMQAMCWKLPFEARIHI